MVSERTPITDLPIHTFKPQQDGQPWLAKIGSVSTMPMLFSGASEMAAYGAAFKWRKEELAKVAARAKPYNVFPKRRDEA